MNRKNFALFVILFAASQPGSTSAEATYTPPGGKPDVVMAAPYPTTAPAPSTAKTAPLADPNSAIRIVARLNSKLAAQNEQLANDFRKAELDRTGMATAVDRANDQVAQLRKLNESLVDRNTVLEKSLFKKEGELAASVEKYQKIEAGMKSVLGVSVIIILGCALIAIAVIFIITRASKLSTGISAVLARVPDEATAEKIARLQKELDFYKDVADRETRRVAVLRTYQRTDQAQIALLQERIRTNAEAMANIGELQRQLELIKEKHRRASQRILDMKLYQEDTDTALATLQARLLTVLAEVEAMKAPALPAENNQQLTLPLAIQNDREDDVGASVDAGALSMEAPTVANMPVETAPAVADEIPPEPENVTHDPDDTETIGTISATADTIIPPEPTPGSGEYIVVVTKGDNAPATAVPEVDPETIRNEGCAG